MLTCEASNLSLIVDAGSWYLWHLQKQVRVLFSVSEILFGDRDRDSRFKTVSVTKTPPRATGAYALAIISIIKANKICFLNWTLPKNVRWSGRCNLCKERVRRGLQSESLRFNSCWIGRSPSCSEFVISSQTGKCISSGISRRVLCSCTASGFAWQARHKRLSARTARGLKSLSHFWLPWYAIHAQVPTRCPLRWSSWPRLCKCLLIRFTGRALTRKIWWFPSLWTWWNLLGVVILIVSMSGDVSLNPAFFVLWEHEELRKHCHQRYLCSLSYFWP